ncbi:hypothetical protein K458DRAFT_408233 [Lentithecium fluviatile CBS 122367]|uniref:Uncharacterized protein n=1 Tax=Lentithecium fluviatile CBS 122367 TaxID=1168545 RepID=A0A6G1IN54_9PLEO|nr:hypothetical protein K458DRAFT_408233 [Lentithecium fluviatile CBS 122367]
MAKKKKQKQKQTDWASPPQSPKPASEEPVPAVPASLPLSPATDPTEPTQDETALSLATPAEAKVETPIEEPAAEPVVEDAPTVEEKEEASVPKEEDKTEPAPEVVEEAKELEPAVEAAPAPEPVAEEKKDEVPDEAPTAPVDAEISVPEPEKKAEGSVSDDWDAVENWEDPPESPVKEKEPEPVEPNPVPGPEALPVAEEAVTAPEPTVEKAPTADSEPSEPEKAPTKKSGKKSKKDKKGNRKVEVEVVEVPEPAPVEAKSEPAPEPEPASVDVESAPAPEPEPTPIEAKSPPISKPASPIPPSVTPEPVPSPPPSVTAPSPLPVAAEPPPPAPEAAPSPPRSVAAPQSPRSVATERLPASAPVQSPPKASAVKQVIEESRPPAPSPPVTRVRPRHVPAFDDDIDDDSALIQPRLRGEALSRDSSRGSTYPPPQQPRSLFASRVPAEHYPNPAPPPPPPPPPPQYHQPRYYPPAAPSYYHGHGHNMSQSGGYPPYGPPSHASSPYQESWGHVPNYAPYGTHSPPQRHDSMGSREYGPPAIESGSAIEDDSGDVFSRIAQAIPDLHVLLAKYKETHGQLGVREELLRRASAEQQEKLRIKDDEITTLRERLANMEHKHSTEAGRLRLSIGNMEEQVKELGEKLALTEGYKDEAERLRATLTVTMQSWETKYKELEEAHANLQKISAEEMAKALAEFEEWKTTTTTRNDAEKIALAIQFDKKLKEADVAHENLRQETAAAFVKEKEDLRSELQRQLREREANFDNMRKELETKLGAAQLDGEQALKRERETMEVWSKERGTLVQAHREDIESLRKSWEDQRALLEGQHKKIKDESDKAWIDLHAEANRMANEHKAVAEQLRKDKEELQKQYNDLRAEHEKEKQVIKTVANNLDAEKSRLEKLMECYGDIAEIKSKGDTYYLVSFSQLQKQIMDLAATHFVHLPVAPPPEDLAQIPSAIPSFLGETSSSRQLRAAYVAHTVSKLVTYRVFGPFLFSLGRRYDKADSLFLSMSNHIRDKSTRKEAIWRQQTLLAAFTSSGAKQRINTAAGTVVEEIVNAVKHFADPKEEEGIKIAVKRIVKLAAETWRFARLEREMITAIMPSVNDEEHQFTGPEYWPSHRPEGTPIASLAGTAPPSDEKPKLLLRLFPVIYREPKHENLRNPDEEKPDEGCVYHHGLALYDDAEPVAQRAEELQAAGLPPVTSASPTAADFPPPLVPSPRNPPPPTPDVEKASVRSKSPPPEPTGDIEKASVRSKSPAPEATETADKASVRSKSPAPSVADKTSVRSKSPPPEATDAADKTSTRSKSPAPSIADKTSVRSKSPPPVPPKSASIRSRRSVASVRSQRSSTPPPPPPPRSVVPSEPPSSPKPAPSEHSHAPYTRPLPGPIEFGTPRAVSPHPPPESVAAPPSNASAVPPLPVPTESVAASAPAAPPTDVGEVPPPLAPTESVAPSAARTPPTETEEAPPLPAPTESAIIPPFNPEASQQDLPTPPQSRAQTPSRPISPLFAALDEIDALSSHRSRNPSSSRRSARTRTSDEELHRNAKDRPDTARRTSGYSLSTRSSDQASQRTERTDRTERTERSSNSRYMCESRSAAIKALYPNSPLAGNSPSLSRTNSLRSRRRESADVGTWDMSTPGLTSVQVNQEPSTGS